MILCDNLMKIKKGGFTMKDVFELSDNTSTYHVKFEQYIIQ